MAVVFNQELVIEIRYVTQKAGSRYFIECTRTYY